MDSIRYEELKKKIIEYLRNSLKETRFEHTLNVALLAKQMAKEQGVDVQKAETAALLHDMARNIPLPTMNMYIERMGLPEGYRDNRNLAHGKIASVLAKQEFEIDDDDILNAISYHTTGRSGMSELEKIIFLADAIEPRRDYPGVDDIRKQAENSIDKACLMSLENTVKFLKKQGVYIDTDTLKAKEYFEQLKEKG